MKHRLRSTDRTKTRCSSDRTKTRCSSDRTKTRWGFRYLTAAVVAGLIAVQAAPVHADVDQITQAFRAIRDWRVDEARELAEKLYEKRPDDPLVLALVAEVKLNMSDYAGAVMFYDRAIEAGAPEAAVINRARAESARVATQDYVEFVSDNFIIRHAPGKDAVLVPFAIETLESALERIGGLLGWRPTSRIVVEFYPSAATLAQVSTLTEDDIKNSGTIALCKWNRLMVTTPRGVVFGYGWRDTVAHELTHLIIGGASRNSVPIWLHEGIAKFAESAWRGEPGLALSVESQRDLRKAAKANKLIPFEKMHPSMAKLPTQDQTALAFAEVFTFIEYMVNQKGWAAMREVMTRMAGGRSDAEAIEEVFGMPLDKLSKKWMATLPKRAIRSEGASIEHEVVIKQRSETPDDALHGLSKKARRFARAADLLYARGRFTAAQKELEKAYGATKSPLIAAKLAHLALSNNDLERAETAAREAMSGEAALSGPKVTLAEVLVRTNRDAEAQDVLTKAIGINPFDPRVHSIRLKILTKALGDKEPTAEQSKKLNEAMAAYQWLTKPFRQQAPLLGIGGLITVHTPTFTRVFVERQIDDRWVTIPTGMITPTAPIALRPGEMRLRLVPAKGPEIVRPITVKPTTNDGAAQAVRPDMNGS